MTNRTTTSGTAAQPRIHVVWDWNGTVRDDLSDHVAALNATLPDLGGSPVSVETYRALHRVPIRSFYDLLLHREITDEEWLRGDAAFLAVLDERPVRLRAGARQIMLGLRAAGHRQSLLSLAPHERLVHEVEKAGITKLLDRIDGRIGTVVRTKGPALAAHLAALGVPPDNALVIGDSLDDAVAAQEVGAYPVLHTGGLHSAQRLATAGVTLVDTLQEAVEVGIAAIAERQGTAT
ncbi:HAD family hydrolase [Kitasatospora sp. NPDC057015]|uniref:HAD family hydrolase n=1 Tax=Kitasatospora sp. NPDC057015 TaxID=3346001 RepID=UPI00362A1779